MGAAIASEATVSEIQAAASFDYGAPAELFPMRSRKGNRPMGYRRFAKAADAIRFAIEELPPELLRSAELEVEERKLSCEDMRRLYDHVEFPLARRTASAAG